jgi:hypothetical protein
VGVAVRRQFVSIGSDFTHKLWMTICHPAQHKESGPGVVIAKQLQYEPSALAHSSRNALPLVARYHAIERVNVKIVLDVEGECVEHRGDINVRTWETTNYFPSNQGKMQAFRGPMLCDIDANGSRR